MDEPLVRPCRKEKIPKKNKKCNRLLLGASEYILYLNYSEVSNNHAARFILFWDFFLPTQPY